MVALDAGSATLTSGGTANTKGSYTELVSSTSTDAAGLLVRYDAATGNTTSNLIDIAIGAASSEQIIVDNMLLDNNVRYAHEIIIPLRIPAGTRIAARSQSSTSSGSVICQIHLITETFGNDLPPVGYVTTYGAATADSGGTSVDPGGTANTKGGYTEIIASTAKAHCGLIFLIGHRNNGTMVQTSWLVDIAVGAASSEQVIISNIQVRADPDEQLTILAPFIPVQIPAGTRLSIRVQCSITDATDRILDYCLLGVG